MSITLQAQPGINGANFNQGQSFVHPFGLSPFNTSSRAGANFANPAKFTEINPTEAADELKELVRDFTIDTKVNKALLSADKKTLVLTLTGKVAAKRFFNNSWLSRVFGGGSKLAAKWYREQWDPKQNKNLEYQSESLEDLVGNLRKDHYYAQVLFKRDEKTGRFNTKEPNFISITDSLFFAAKSGKLGEAMRNKFRHHYTIDKTISNPKDKRLIENTQDVVEALITAMSAEKPTIIVPFKIEPQGQMHSASIAWDYPLLRADGKWEIKNGPYSFVSFARPQELASNPIDEEVAALHAHTLTFSGPNPMDKSETNKNLVDTVALANQMKLREYNLRPGSVAN